jgi:signal transduction histidine kinase/DNA-binding response OmpR family regulator
MSTETILVIDDEPSMRYFCQRALGQEGFEVRCVPSGLEGIQSLAETDVDLILLDIHLPDIHGLEVLQAIQEIDRELPVIVVTGYGTMETAVNALQSGARDFLSKPFTVHELVTSVQSVLERQRLQEENVRLKARLPILEISKALMSETNPARLTQLALETVQRELRADRVSLMLLDEARQELTISAAIGLSDQAMADTQVKVGEGLAGLVAQTREPLLVVDQAEDAPFLQPGVRSAICVPLMLQNHVLGVLNASRPLGAFPFRQDDVDLLSILCGQIAVALENARLFDRAQREIAERVQAEDALRHYADRLSILHEIEQGILAARSPRAIAQAAVSRIRQLIPCQRTSVALFDERTRETMTLAVDADYETKVGCGTRFSAGSFTGDLEELGRERIVTWEISPSQDKMLEALYVEGIRSYVSVLLVAQGQGIGLLNLAMSDPEAFTEEHKEIARQVADQLAIAIQQARLSAAEVQRRQEAEALRDTAAALNSTLDLETVLERILDNAGRVVPHDSANIMFVEDGVARIVRHRGYAHRGLEDTIQTVRFAVADTPTLSQMAVSRQPLAISDPQVYVNWVATPGVPMVRSYAAAPICSEGAVIGFLNLNSNTPSFFTVDHAERLQAFADQSAVALENARLHEQVQRYVDELEQRVADRTKELAALYEVTAVASRSLEIETTLARSLEQALSAMDGCAGSIQLLDETKGTLCLATQQVRSDVVGQRDATPADTTLAPVSESDLASWVIERDEPLVVSDVTTDVRVSRMPSVQPTQSTQRAPYTTALHAYVGVPMRARRRTIGVLNVFGERGQEFNVEDVALLASIADHVAVAVENDRLRQRAERVAVIEERERLARDLHDSVTQSLYSLTLFAEAGRELAVAGELEGARHHLARVGEIAQHALKEMRLMIYELRPLALEREGLVGALHHRLEAVEGRVGVEARLLVEELIDLPAHVEEGLYRIAQEALNNALKHAAAVSVVVHLRTRGGQIELEVVDDGVGFDLERTNAGGGMGLIGMRERAQKLGGTFSVLSAPGKGTRVKVRVEIQRRVL